MTKSPNWRRRFAVARSPSSVSSTMTAAGSRPSMACGRKSSNVRAECRVRDDDLRHRSAIVPDMTADPRFDRSPLVTGDPFCRFYCGMPLITDEGYALGTLCVMDFEPRQLTFEQIEALRRLSRQVLTQLELRRQLIEHDHTIKEPDQARSKSPPRRRAPKSSSTPCCRRRSPTSSRRTARCSRNIPARRRFCSPISKASR